MAPSAAPTSRESAVVSAVMEEFGDIPFDEASPQRRAIQWLTEKDTTITFPLDSEELQYGFYERYVAAVCAYTTQYWFWVKNDNWLTG